MHRPDAPPSSVHPRPACRHAVVLSVAAMAAALPAGALSPLAAQARSTGDGAARVEAATAAMSYRMVGPFRGGRSTAVAGFPDDAHHFLMGTTGGGVWMTDDAGTTWRNVMDDFLDVGSIGAVEVAPGDPNVIYVGTGSAGVRGNVSIGRGVWRSTDRGRTWSFVGLRGSGSVAKIQVDPRDADVAFAAVLGNPFGKNEERGVYRTRDGGATWQRVLFVADSVGAVDLVMNPRNPRELYAAMWRAQRTPWTLVDASTDGGIFKSIDGGDTWKRLTDAKADTGLPHGVLFGRIGLAMSAADPDRVWALISAADPHGGIWRSDDAGASWRKINRDRRFRQRHWYYSHLEADPVDPNTLYVMNTGLYRSVDGGEDWEGIRVPHGDVHDLWIHPDDPAAMVVANDGGAQVSLNAGRTWSTMNNQPTAEFYRLEVDNQWPYRLYGAQQDNSTISVSSAPWGVLTPEGDWREVGGAESGHVSVHPHPDSAHLVWAGNYIGQIDRSNLKTGASRNMILYPLMGDGIAPRDQPYRFQWNAPILVSRHDPSVVYHASQFVHRTTDGGMSWQTISPDLTTNNPEQQGVPGGPLQHDHTGVEVYNTVFVLSESPRDAAELWAGTDDGRVHLTRDGGATWTEITPRGMPAGGTVNSIDLDPTRPGRAVMAVYRYREDDFRPHVFATEDFGGSWRRLTDGANGIPADHPVRVVRLDPEAPGVLYAGTEFALFVSVDDGRSWQSLQLDLPATPITDLRVHRGDLVVATQGRSFWILDDLTPLRRLGPEVMASPVALLPPRPAYRGMPGGFRGGDAPEGPETGAVAYLWLGSGLVGQEVEIELVDPRGVVIREWEGTVKDPDATPEPSARLADDGGGEPGLKAVDDEPAKDPAKASDPAAPGADQAPEPTAEAEAAEGDAEEDEAEDPLKVDEEIELETGLNRVRWDLRYRGPDVLPDARFSLASTAGVWAPPGAYTLRVEVADTVLQTVVELRADPRDRDVTAADLEANLELALRVRDRLTEVHDAVRVIRSVREQARTMVRRLDEVAEARGDEGLADVVAALEEEADALAEELTAVEKRLIQTRNESGQDPINFPSMLDDQLAYLYSHVNASYGLPTRGAYQRFDDLVAATAPLLARVQAAVDGPVAEFNRILTEAGLGAVVVPVRAR